MLVKKWGEIGDQIFKITTILTKLYTKEKKQSTSITNIPHNSTHLTKILCNPHNPKAPKTKYPIPKTPQNKIKNFPNFPKNDIIPKKGAHSK